MLIIIAYFHFSPQKKKKKIWNFREQKNFRPRAKNLFAEKEEEDFDYKSIAHCRIFPSFLLKKKLEFSRTKKFSFTSEKEEEEKKTSIINRSLIVACFHFFPSKIWNFREQKNLFAKKKRKKTSIINRLLIVAYFHLSPQKKRKNRNFREQKNFHKRKIYLRGKGGRGEENFDYKSIAHCIFPFFPSKKKKNLEFSRTKKFSPTSEKEEEEKKTSIINRPLIAYFHFSPQKFGIFDNKKIFAYGRKIYFREKGGRRLR